MQLYDANGNAFRIRGVNRQHFDVNSGQAVQNARANAERWVLYWGSSRTNASQYVTQMISDNYNRKIVAIPTCFAPQSDGYNGTTYTAGSQDINLFNACVDDWVAQASAWNGSTNGVKNERWMLINIANEWGPGSGYTGSTAWRDAYINAVRRMRGVCATTAGCTGTDASSPYLGTLVIDAGDFAKAYGDVITYGQAVFDADPQKNIVFSIHGYDYTAFTTNTYGHPPVATWMASVNATGLPWILGEFAYAPLNGAQTTALQEITAAENAGVGWMAWSWDAGCSGGGSFALSTNCTTYNSSSDLTAYGKTVVEDPTYGLKALATPASVFP